MEFNGWLYLTLVCLAGAVVPGASLVVVLQSVLAGGRRHGLITAWSHALAVGIYGLITATGLTVVLAAIPQLLLIIKLFGAGFLLFMSLSLLRQPVGMSGADLPGATGVNSATKGFLIAFLNPKLALFFLALFSQFVTADMSVADKLLMGLVAMLVDGFWYSGVVLLAARPSFNQHVQRQGRLFSRLFAGLLLLLAMQVVWSVI